MTGRVPGLVLLLAVAGACGPSSAEIKRARTAHYSCSADQVFAAVVKEVQAKQPPVASADQRVGVVSSQLRWHSASGLRKKAGAAVVGPGDLSFGVIVAIEKRARGLFVNAQPALFTHVVGSPRGERLTPSDADWPEWADVKVSNLLVGIHKRLKGCAVAAE